MSWYAAAKLPIKILVFVLVLTFVVIGDDPPYGNLRLLDGYKYQRSKTVDTINGRIYNADGFSIEFESGISEGYAADPTKRREYIWFREQTINGNKVYLAFTKPGVGTQWEPVNRRKSNTGRIVLVTFPGNFGLMDAANFFAEVTNDEELADMLLMVSTFDPNK